MELRLCKCGCTHKPDMIVAEYVEDNSKFYYRRCKQCGETSKLSQFKKIVDNDWNKRMKANNKHNFSCKMDGDIYKQMCDRTKRLGIPKVQFVMDALEYILEQTKDWTREKYLDEMYWDK